LYHQKILKDSSHHVFVPNAAQLAEWKKVLEPAIEAWMGDDPGKKYLLQTYKAEVAKAGR
jgi:hypothetical protein